MYLIIKIKSLIRKKEFSEGKASILKNIFWLVIDRVLRLGIGLFIGSAVARYLGPVQWGKINYVLAFVTIAIAVVSMGLDGFLIKELLENPEKKNKYLGTAFFLRSFFILLSLIVILIIYKYLDLEIEYFKIFVLLFLTVAVLPFDLIDLDYQSKLKSKKTVQAKSMAYIIGSIFKIGAIILKMPIIVFAAIIGFEAILASFFLIKKYNNKDGDLKLWSYDYSLIKYILKKAWPFLLSAVSVILYMRLDQIMLGNLLPIKKVGEFSAAVRVSEIFLFIPAAITSSYYSVLLRAKEGISSNSYKFKVQILFNIMFLLSFTIAITVFIFSNVIVYILYGKNFIEATSILRIHIWSLIAVFLGVAGNQYLVIENLQRITFYSTFIGLVTNIIFNLFFIPKFGGIGAAYATLISYSFSAIFSNILFIKSRGLFKYQYQSIFLIFKPKLLINGIRNIF